MLIESSSIPKYRDLSQPGDDVFAVVHNAFMQFLMGQPTLLAPWFTAKLLDDLLPAAPLSQ